MGMARHQPNGNDQTAQVTERKIGDVLIAWENEAYLAQKEQPGQFEIITPSLSILAEPTVALVDENAKKKGNTLVAKGYLNFLYSPLAQNIIAQNYYRPRNPEILKKYTTVFKPLKLVTIDEQFGGWKKAQKTHFDNGGIFDQIIQANQQ